MQKKLPEVYIILLNYNGWSDTLECLESLLRIDYPNYRVVVVDNHSADGSMEYLQAWAKGELDVWADPAHPLRRLSFPPLQKPLPYLVYHQHEVETLPDSTQTVTGNNQTASLQKPLIFIRAEQNLGFAGGNNLGLKYALVKSGDYALLLNNDTVVTPSFLSALVRQAEELPYPAILGGNIFYYDLPQRVWAAGGGNLSRFTAMSRHKFSADGGKDTKSANEKMDYITGCLMLIKREILKKTGLFDENYFLYYEESDLCFRAGEAGYSCFYAPESVIYHKVSATVQPAATVGTYYMTRNRHYFIKKHYRGVYRFSALTFVTGFNFLRKIYHLLRGRPDKSKAITRAVRDANNGNMGGVAL